MTHRIPEENRGELLKEQNIQIGELQLRFSLHQNYLVSENRSAYSLTVTGILDGETETVCARDVTSLRDTALTLFDTVSRAEVTPCTLFDVLEELL